MNYTKYPRRNYLQGATPIEPMPSLSKALGNGVNLFVKRDDLLPGASGGNKTRKLEFCIADALEQGADTIITCGAVQSNHARLYTTELSAQGIKDIWPGPEYQEILLDVIKEVKNATQVSLSFPAM